MSYINFLGATPPEEIILFGRNSASMVLLNGTATHSYNITAPPAAVNTIERRLYWFNSQMNTLHSMLMAGGDEKVNLLQCRSFNNNADQSIGHSAFGTYEQLQFTFNGI